MEEEAEAVLLGTIKVNSTVNDRCPYTSKAGGIPAWYEKQVPPKEANSLTCASCKEELYLVSQVYAPAEKHRTLYIFGCNSSECTEYPGSWRVLRHQMPFETTKNIKEEEEQEKAKVATKSPQASAWASGDAADDSDWSEDEPETDSIKTDESNFDFEDLLKRRDEAMFGSNDKSKAQKEQEANPIPFNISQLPTTSFNNTNKAFNALHLEVTEEPYEDYVKENDFSHENELLKQYIQQEEEEKSSDFESLRQLLGSKREAKSNSSTGESVSSESYERTPAHQRQFLRFQKRISRCPLQCMRYDYGGEPLWPTNVPRNLKIPKCKCGQDRVFEIQLIPTINYFLKVDDYVTGTIQINGTSVKKTGMDWASILVYSCPSSCERSNEEFIYVVPPINT